MEYVQSLSPCDVPEAAHWTRQPGRRLDGASGSKLDDQDAETDEQRVLAIDETVDEAIPDLGHYVVTQGRYTSSPAAIADWEKRRNHPVFQWPELEVARHEILASRSASNVVATDLQRN